MNAQLLHVTHYNNLMMLRKQYQMVMTTGNGSMLDKPRVRGWVIWGQDFAKWYPNIREAKLELSTRN